MEDVSEASITDRNELLNKNSSMMHPSSFTLIYWFISLPLFLCPLAFSHPHPPLTLWGVPKAPSCQQPPHLQPLFSIPLS